jgi:PAS domain S-box-containing protein/putative nucleotidyltransferase with HDIG domain
MDEKVRTHEEMIKEISVLKRRNLELEQSEAERKRVVEELRIQDMQLRTILESTGDGIIAVDQAGSVIKTNQKCASFLNIPSELLERGSEGAFLTYVFGQLAEPGAFLEKVRALHQSAAEDFDTILFRDGRIVESYSCPLLSEGVLHGRVWSFRDITGRKQAEEALRDSESKYQFLAESMADVVFMLDLNLTTTYVSPSIERMLGYTPEERMAQPVDQQLTRKSQALVFETLIAELDREKEKGADPDRSLTLELEYYHRNGSIRHLTTYIRGIRDSEGNLTGLYGSHHDITDRKKAEEDLRKSVGQLRRAMQTTIQVLGLVAETKDPYTAGHQKRTTDLARAMATEMGLPPEQIEGIRMAGVIHDIGKISLPTEILSKPTKLSNIEFSLIKQHAQQGYEILKEVESPWALAEMVYQHHERINGSGYPRGLKGDEILIEARILAVADVVESMASHRPYRAALGIGAALEEIIKNRGVLYDPVVVDACLRLFQERGYKLAEA